MLPIQVTNFLNERNAGAPAIPHDASLFDTGVLDSFSLAEFITVIEDATGISIPDADLNPETFETIAKTEAYIARSLGA